ncbi:MAG: hypothetical protein IT173_10695 [Acidobacteria bacterium]|nr:hypothetical protein [Acidobacteriota bacterium]
MYLFILVTLAASPLIFANNGSHEANALLVRPMPMPTPTAANPKFAYKGVSLGMLADDIRKLLGDPKERSDAQDLYVFSDEESAQFIYDASHKVTAIMLTFSGKLTGAPLPKDVFGEDVAPRPDGGISKMVRYEKAGYWVAYNKIVGDDPMISIAMQRIQ